jgi:glycine cleavage system H protein
MPEYLQTTVDKFTFRVAKDRLYSSDGIWLLPLASEGKPRIRIGVTDFFQQRSGDIAFVHLKPQGASFHPGDEFAEFETMKVDVGLNVPITGTIVDTNKALHLTPEDVNQDPYEKGWLAVIEATDWESERAKLLDPPAYLTVMREQAELELKS